MREGKVYSAIGANYDTLFGRLLQNKNDNSSLENLERLAAKGIPFLRFRACGFSPQKWQLYLDQPDEYFGRMDQVVHTAEQHHIGLIPSLFWRLATISELVHESPDRVGDPRSKASQFIQRYTREMVSRYKDSPAIWGWEFGNEANNGVDLPRPEQGVRLTSGQLTSIYAVFARTVRSIDPDRVIETGTTVPRPAAWHNAHGQPRQRDSAAQSYAMLLMESPDPANMLSVHIYQKARKLAPYGPETVNQFIGRYARTAVQAGKPLFIGEFPVRNPAQATEFIHAIEANHVPLSAFWTFDNSKQESTMNVTFQNGRAFALDLVVKANQALQSP
jgi:endo-1,4-beta-mannosidase